MNINIHLTELGHAKAILCKSISNFCKRHKQIRICEKVFSLKKIISLKHSGVRSCFEAFIETNTTVQSDFDFDARCWNYSIFYLQNYVHACAVGSVIVPHMHATLTVRTAVRLVWFTAGRKLAVSRSSFVPCHYIQLTIADAKRLYF